MTDGETGMRTMAHQGDSHNSVNLTSDHTTESSNSIKFNELNIQPIADQGVEAEQSSEVSLTQRLIRRAAEIRRSWDDPESERLLEILAFDAVTPSEVVSEEHDRSEEAEDETENLDQNQPHIAIAAMTTQALQAKLSFHDGNEPDQLQKTLANTGVNLSEQFSGTEADIVAILQAQPGLGAKQVCLLLYSGIRTDRGQLMQDEIDSVTVRRWKYSN